MKKSHLLSVLLIIIVLFSFILLIYAADNTSKTGYMLKVKVYDRQSNPVSGALVRISGQGITECCYTSTSGYCGIIVQSAGYYDICASKDNYGQDRNVYVNSNLDVDMTLENYGYNCESCDQPK